MQADASWDGAAGEGKRERERERETEGERERERDKETRQPDSAKGITNTKLKCQTMY